jgi:hypothetical protein
MAWFTVDSKIGVNSSVVRCIEHESEVEDTTVKRVGAIGICLKLW